MVVTVNRNLCFTVTSYRTQILTDTILNLSYVIRHSTASVFPSNTLLGISQEKYGRYLSNNNVVEKQNKIWNGNSKFWNIIK